MLKSTVCILCTMCNVRKVCRLITGNNESSRLVQHFSRLTDLDDVQREAIRLRFIHILEEFSSRCTRYSVLYHMGHLIITVGSLIVPALLSVQYTSNDINFIPTSNMQANIYWLTWSLSLLVTMFNGILVLYKVDKKYFFLHTTRERLRSEGWQYIQLTGRYAGGLLQYRVAPTHKNQLVFFCHNVEKIRMRQIEEEYYKNDEANQTASIQARNIQNAAAGAGSGTASAGTGTTDASGNAIAGGSTHVVNIPAGVAKELYPPTFSDDIDRFYAMTQQFKDAPPPVQALLGAMIRAGRRASLSGSKDASGNAVALATDTCMPPPTIPRPSLQPSVSTLPPSKQFTIDTNAIAERLITQSKSGDFSAVLGGTTNDVLSPELPPSPPSPQMTSIPEEI